MMPRFACLPQACGGFKLCKIQCLLSSQLGSLYRSDNRCDMLAAVHFPATAAFLWLFRLCGYMSLLSPHSAALHAHTDCCRAMHQVCTLIPQTKVGLTSC